MSLCSTLISLLDAVRAWVRHHSGVTAPLPSGIVARGRGARFVAWAGRTFNL
jgi:hypothetical protein